MICKRKLSLILLFLMILMTSSACTTKTAQENDVNDESNYLDTSKVIENPTVSHEISFTHTETKMYEIDVNDTYESFTIIVNHSSYEYDNYLHGGQKAGIYIEYPIVSGLSDSGIQDKINTIIKNEIYENDKLTPDTIVESNVCIEFASQDLLCLSYEKYYDHTSAAHPVTAKVDSILI